MGMPVRIKVTTSGRRKMFLRGVREHWLLMIVNAELRYKLDGEHPCSEIQQARGRLNTMLHAFEETRRAHNEAQQELEVLLINRDEGAEPMMDETALLHSKRARNFANLKLELTKFDLAVKTARESAQQAKQRQQNAVH
jgi:hypothetical protein